MTMGSEWDNGKPNGKLKCHSIDVTRHQYHKYFLTIQYRTKFWKTFSQQNTLAQPSLIIWIWVNTFQKFLPKTAKTLGVQGRNLAFAPKCNSTKEAAYKTLVRPKQEYAAPIWSTYSNLQINQIEKVQGQQPAGSAGDCENK